MLGGGCGPGFISQNGLGQSTDASISSARGGSPALHRRIFVVEDRGPFLTIGAARSSVARVASAADWPHSSALPLGRRARC